MRKGVDKRARHFRRANKNRPLNLSTLDPNVTNKHTHISFVGVFIESMNGFLFRGERSLYFCSNVCVGRDRGQKKKGDDVDKPPEY
jgi:hypothetical protein